MDCTEARSLFSAAYDGDKRAAAALAPHLSACPDCAEAHRAYTRMLDGVRALPAPEAPAGLHESLMRAAETHTAKAAGPAPLRKALLAVSGMAACFALLCLLVTGIANLFNRLQPYGAPQTAAGPRAVAPSFQTAAVQRTESNGTAAATLPEPLANETIAADSPASGGAAAPYAAAGAAELDSGINAAAADDTASLNKQQAADYPASEGFSAEQPDADETGELLSAGYYEQAYYVDILVDDLETARAAVERYTAESGFLIESRMAVHENATTATVRRRVDAADYAAATQAIRGLGEVVYENEWVNGFADEVTDLEARLAAKEAEAERLKELLAASRTMEVLAAVEARLGAVETERDDVRGVLNQRYAICAQPILTVELRQSVPPAEPDAQADFTDRMSQSFIGSVDGLLSFMEDFVVWLSGAVIPLAALAGLAAAGYALGRKIKKARRQKGKPPLFGKRASRTHGRAVPAYASPAETESGAHEHIPANAPPPEAAGPAGAAETHTDKEADHAQSK